MGRSNSEIYALLAHFRAGRGSVHPQVCACARISPPQARESEHAGRRMRWPRGLAPGQVPPDFLETPTGWAACIFRFGLHSPFRLMPTPSPNEVIVLMIRPEQPWHVPVRLDDVPETGLHLHLVADDHIRAGLAALAGVLDVPRLEAAIDVARHGSGLRATGRVTATVGQTCVVTLEPMQNQVDEVIDVVFTPASAGEFADQTAAFEAGDPPEALSDGTADIGALAAEFLLLGIDPYPRKPGAEFTPPREGSATTTPFAALSKLKDAKN
jgi:hypothetical protein